MSGETLKPCPFCGGPALEPRAWNGTLETGCAGPHECPGTDVLVPIAAWNTRAEPASAPALVEALRAAKELIDTALPQFDWGSSALSAEAIQLLNETPGKVNAALAQAGMKP